MENTKYTKTAIILHWVMAIFVFYALFSGLFKGALPKGELKTLLMYWHQWIGQCVFFLLFVRLGWRLFNPAPKLESNTPMQSLQNKMAHIAHYVLYALMAIIPLTGVLFMNAKGYQVNFFGIPMPELMTKDTSIYKFLKESHEILGFTLGGLILVHILASLKHHFIDKDGLLNRMKP